MILEDCNFSESLVATYTSYKNGGRDREKLTSEQLKTAFILESEFVLTAVYYFVEFLDKMNGGDSFDCVSSPAHVIDNLDYENFADIASVFVKSRLHETKVAVEELEEFIKNGVE